MLYPTRDIDEIMPDSLIEEIDEKLGSDYKNEINYFTNSEEVRKGMRQRKASNTVMGKDLNSANSGAKGTLPDGVFMHPDVCYAYKSGNVVLTGLNNSIELSNELSKK